jgi:rod shape determining protein RodA
MLLQAKGQFVPEQHTDYIFVTTNSEWSVDLVFAIGLLLLIGSLLYLKRRKKA